MLRLFINRSKAGWKPLHNLWVSVAAFPQLVFIPFALRITRRVVRSLCNFTAQVSAQIFYANPSVIYLFIPTIHNPNKSYYKGD